MPPVVVVSVLFVSSSVTRMFLRPVPWPPLAPSMDGGRGTFEKRTDRPNLDYIYCLVRSILLVASRCPSFEFEEAPGELSGGTEVVDGSFCCCCYCG